MKNIVKLLILLFALSGQIMAQKLLDGPVVEDVKPLTVDYTVEGALVKKLSLKLSITNDYANLSVYANENLLLDNIDIPTPGEHTLDALVRFESVGQKELKLVSKNGAIVINALTIEEAPDLDIPAFQDISEKVGLDRVNSIKYGGPCVADVDQDGDYDFIVINHNEETNKLYWNNGDGTVTKHDQDLSRWWHEDLHGASCADFDRDGDLDIMQTKGGGNGLNPSLPDFWRNDNGKLVLVTRDVGITAGARGRGARWIDMDLDDDLDLMLVNAKGIAGETPQHLFYRNKGDGTFELVSVPGIELADAQRALVTDVNGDNIDDIILYDPTNTLWLGNGDFTFTNATTQFPQGLDSLNRFMGATDIDIDNDGDFDLYFARGYAFGVGNKPSFDFCPVHMQLDIKIRNSGSFELGIEADKDIDFHNYAFVGRNGFDGTKYPVYLGANKEAFYFDRGGRMMITQLQAQGWPQDISGNGIYFGYIGEGKWRSAVVINGDIFWDVGFTLTGVKNATPEFIALNRNAPDILLRNDGGKFTDVSKEWHVPQSGNHSGVAVGDLNNDGHQDLFLHRWGFLSSKPADYLLLNTGKGHFESITMTDASNAEDMGHGDMGQIFDFDLDGDVDMLNGSDDNGMWYLYDNTTEHRANYALVKVGYSPESYVDAISAEVVLKTATKTYRKRVGSSGEIFSQSMMNIMHFGLGDEEVVKEIVVTWRNGEKAVIKDKKANQLFDTDKIDPATLTLSKSEAKVRQGTAINLKALIAPVNADKTIEWSSSDESIMTVKDGVVTALGKPKKKAVITATSKANGMQASCEVEVVKFYDIQVESVQLEQEKVSLFEGESLSLEPKVLPQYADNPKLEWISSNETVATVDASGELRAIGAGQVTIKALSVEAPSRYDEMLITVEPFIEPIISYDDSNKYAQRVYVVGDTIEITFDYHAGSGRKVASQDLGGIKVMFRELDYRRAYQSTEVVLPEALGTQSGTMTAKISLDGFKPSDELEEGRAYYMFLFMASSDGILVKNQLDNIKVIKAE